MKIRRRIGAVAVAVLVPGGGGGTPAVMAANDEGPTMAAPIESFSPPCHSKGSGAVPEHGGSATTWGEHQTRNIVIRSTTTQIQRSVRRTSGVGGELIALQSEDGTASKTSKKGLETLSLSEDEHQEKLRQARARIEKRKEAKGTQNVKEKPSFDIERYRRRREATPKPVESPSFEDAKKATPSTVELWRTSQGDALTRSTQDDNEPCAPGLLHSSRNFKQSAVGRLQSSRHGQEARSTIDVESKQKDSVPELTWDVSNEGIETLNSIFHAVKSHLPSNRPESFTMEELFKDAKASKTRIDVLLCLIGASLVGKNFHGVESEVREKAQTILPDLNSGGDIYDDFLTGFRQAVAYAKEKGKKTRSDCIEAARKLVRLQVTLSGAQRQLGNLCEGCRLLEALANVRPRKCRGKDVAHNLENFYHPNGSWGSGTAEAANNEWCLLTAGGKDADDDHEPLVRIRRLSRL